MINLSLFASGSGSNVKSIINHFNGDSKVRIGSIVTNKADAGVIKYATNGIELIVVKTPQEIKEVLAGKLKALDTDYIILAGFLKKIPSELIRDFKDKILNIHPSLLPKYGGKGMYGQHVHQAVFDNKEIESGMTIHLVNEEYDKGRVLFQESCEITDCRSPEEIGKRVLKLEHYYYPRVIDNYVIGH